MTNFDLGIYGAKRQTWVGSGARAILRRVREQYKDANIDELVEAMLPLIKSDQEALAQVLAYWIPRNLICLESSERNARDGRRARPRDTEVGKMRGRIQRVSLLAMMVPVGKGEKPLGDCTREELSNHSGWIAKITRALKPGQKVGDVFSEAQLWKLRK
jgi:hypothetical protein